MIGGDPVASYATVENSSQNPLDILFSSDSEEGDVYTVCVPDCDSKPQSARVLMQGVPVFGIVDTAADITIMGRTLQKVARAAKLKRRTLSQLR